jgi:hypothetical protein
MIKKLTSILVLGVLLFSCGDDFTDDYNKLKSEYDQLISQKEELQKKNEELKGENLEMVKNYQGDLVSSFISSTLLSLLNDGDEISKTQPVNIFEDGVLIKTQLRIYKNYINSSANFSSAFEVLEYTHTTNDDGVITKSSSNKYTINWGWENQNCVSIIVSEDDDEYVKLELNTDGQYTKIQQYNDIYEFKYNDNKDIIERKITYDKVNIVISVYEYNSDNNLSKIKSTRNGNLSEEIVFVYEENLTTKKSKSYNNDGNLRTEMNQSFNNNGKIVKFYEFETNDKRKRYRDFTYINNVVSSYEAKTESLNNIGEIISTDYQTIEDIENFKIAQYASYQNNRYHMSYSNFKKSTYTSRTVKNNVETYYYKITAEHFDDHRTEQDKHYIIFNKDGSKKQESSYLEHFEESPYAAKKRETINYENGVAKETIIETNANNSKYGTNWIKQN